MRILFFGSPPFAVPTLKLLAAHEKIEIARVFTQPDRRAGRGRKMVPPAVKTAAQELGLEVEQPEKVRGKAFREHCRQFEADAFVVVAYGRIFPGKLLRLPRLGCVNLHSSVLPELRGAAPINWAIARGYTETGVSTMFMEEELDSGPVLLVEKTDIGPDEKAPELTERLAKMGSELMVKTLEGLAEGSLPAREQDHDKATFAPMIKKEDGQIDLSRSAGEIYNLFRAFYPWPGLFVSFRDEPLKLTEVRPAPEFDGSGEAGLMVNASGRLFLCCAEGSWLELLSLQLPGKRSLPAADFINGTRMGESEWLTELQ